MDIYSRAIIAMECMLSSKLVRAFNPNFAATFLDAEGVGALVAIKPLWGFNLVPAMQRELPQYLVAARDLCTPLLYPPVLPHSPLPCSSAP